MWEEIITTYLIPALMAIITGVLTWIGTKVKSVIEEKVTNEKVKDIIYDVVRYTEQTSKELTSSEKFEKALKETSEWLNSKGINITEFELKIMIEATVNSLYGTKSTQ